MRCYKIYDNWIMMNAFHKNSILSISSLSLFCLCLVNMASYAWLVYLVKGLSWSVMPEVTWQFVGSWARVFVVFVYWLSGCDGKLSTQATFQLWDAVFSSRGKIHALCTVASMAGNFAGESWRSSSSFAKISDAAGLVLGQEVWSLFVDGESDWVGTWSRHLHSLSVLLMRLSCEGIGWLGESGVRLIASGSRIFVDSDGGQGSSGLHFFSSFSESTGDSFVRRECTGDRVGVGRRVLGSSK